MTPERWSRICSLFNAALEQPPSRAEEFVQEAANGDAELFEEVMKMLRDRDNTGPLDYPPDRAGLPVFQAYQIVGRRYRILRYVARGGMGEVYEALDLDIEEEVRETVALKTLLPSIAGDESMISRFKREMALARRINHPNVGNVYDLGRHDIPDGRPVLFLTMEFLAGETLESRLKGHKRMSEAEALPLLRQMSEGLDASHAMGIIHRDFKPSNVMLVPTGGGVRAVVTDFGLARQFRASSGPTAALSGAREGTLDYMAPEVLRGAPATAFSDVYALGMTAYRMVTGELPFPKDKPLSAAVKRCHEPVPSPRVAVPGLSAAWETAILAALDADPARRMSGAKAFIQALEGDASVLPAPKPWWIRFRYAIAAGIALLVLAGGAVAWYRWPDASLRLSPEAQALYQKGAEDNAAGAYFAATRALDEAEKLAPHSPQIHAKLAEAWVALDMPERAREETQRVRRENTASLPEAERLQIDAIDLSTTQEYAASAAKYEKVLRLAPDDATVAVDLGHAYEGAARQDEAKRSYLRAAQSPQHSPAAWLRLAVLYTLQGNRDQARQAFDEAEKRYKLTSSNFEGLTEVTLQRGIAANAVGQLDEGASLLGKAIEMARNQENLPEEITATLRLSQNAFMSGDATGADQYARLALETAQRYHFDGLAVRGLINLGNAYVRKQDYPAAEQQYREALDLARQTRSEHMVALSLLSLAAVHGVMDRPKEEIVPDAQEALKFYQTNHYMKETLQCLALLGRAQRDKGDYDGAFASFRSELAKSESSRDKQQISLAHEGLGSTFFELDRYPEALDEYRKMLQLAATDEQAGYANLACGNTLCQMGNYSEAEAAFARADTVAKKLGPLRVQLIYGRADMALSRNQFREAEELASTGLSHGGDRVPLMKNQFDELIGLALGAQGKKKDALAKCDSARAGLAEGHAVSAALGADLVMLEVLIQGGNKKDAARLFEQIRPRLGPYPESRWRALALAASVDRQYAGPARAALKSLSDLWGDSAYQTYVARPDVAKLSAAVLRH